MVWGYGGGGGVWGSEAITDLYRLLQTAYKKASNDTLRTGPAGKSMQPCCVGRGAGGQPCAETKGLRAGPGSER